MTPGILHEDGSLLVLDKPAGVTVNRSETTIHHETLQDWVEKYLTLPAYSPPEKKAGRDGVYDPKDAFYQRAGIVHRLDKETSGIILIAKNPEAFLSLQAQFKERTVKKVYHALAHGRIIPAEGEIKAPVGRLPWNRKQFGIVAGGREAVTKYSILGYYRKKGEQVSLVELYPETGRTHQIRVHLKYIGHPIYSDFLYGGRKTARNDRKGLSRVFLHAAKISFIHPNSGEGVTFASQLPDELTQFLQTFEETH